MRTKVKGHIKHLKGKKVKVHRHSRHVKHKRKGPKLTKASIQKILKNPRTPPQLKPYWEKRLKEAKE